MSFLALDAAAIAPTRNALHTYAKVLGKLLKTARPRRKHWWHASLRPSLTGLTTGVVRGSPSFELDLDFSSCRLTGLTTDGARLDLPLADQSARSVTAKIAGFLRDAGATIELEPPDDDLPRTVDKTEAAKLSSTLRGVAGALEHFRATISEETSPIQIWPHHFDLSMIWLPGTKVQGEEPTDEESSDQQMNFGFTFGDRMSAEPYFYVTAYPTQPAMARINLPAGSVWRSEGFTGVFVKYDSVRSTADPRAYLLDLWTALLEAGRKTMLPEPKR
jgi:hypothetical protein